MKLNVQLNFQGDCAAAFACYRAVFRAEGGVTMLWSEAPGGSPVPAEWAGKVMHASLPLGEGLLMGSDVPVGSTTALGGFHVAVQVESAVEVTRIFSALMDGGSVQMALTSTFWSPLVGTGTDRFGVGWMISAAAA
jgi:PhnB protein